MALGDRFILYVPDVHDGYRYRARIQQEGAASVVELLPALDRAAELFAGEQGVQDPAAPLVRSSMSFRVLKTQGALVSVFGEAMDAFPVIWERQLLSANPTTGPWSTIWRGFLHTRYYEDAPDAWTDEVVLKAHDGIELLKTREYEGVTNSDSVWTTLTGILGGLGFLFGYETIMRWYPYLSSHRTSRILEYLYTQDDRWEDEDEEDLRLSQYDVLVDLLGRFQLQLVQSEGAFHLRQRYNLTGSQSVVEVYNSSGVYTGTGTVDTVNVDPITELQRRPRSFLSQVKQAQSTHEHGDLDELVVNGSFEVAGSSSAAAKFWTIEGVNNFRATRTSEALPSSQGNEYVLRLDATAFNAPNPMPEGARGAYQQNLVYVQPNPLREIDISFWALTKGDDRTGRPIAVSFSVGGHYLAFGSLTVAADAIQGDEAFVEINPLFMPGPVFDPKPGTVIIPAGVVLSFSGGAEMTLSRPVAVGDTTLSGRLSAAVAVGETASVAYWSTTVTRIETADFVGMFTPQRHAWHTRAVSPAGTPVSGYLKIEAFQPVYDPTAATEFFIETEGYLDEVKVVISQDGRPLERSITAATTGTVQDETELVSYSFLTGDGPTPESRARLSVLDGSGARQEITGGWKNGPYTSGEASTQLSIDALHTRLSIRQRKKHLAVRRITFLLHEGESIWPHHVITRGGVNYTIGRYERRFGTGQVYTELIELFQGSDDGIADAVVQEGPSAQGTGGRTLLAVSSGDGGGATDWASITGKPPLVNTFNTRSGDITLTSADVTGALGFTPISLDAADVRYVNVTGDTMTGDLVMASGTLKVNTDHLILDADGAAPGYVKLSSGRIGQQIGAGGTFQPFARTNVAETISATYTFTADPLIDGGNLDFRAPAATGGWSRGIDLFDSSGTRYGKIGTLGSGSSVNYIYIAHGASPHESGLGLYIFPDGNLGSMAFTSRTTGWQVTPAGNADFRSIYADELVVQAFTADVAQTLVGSEYITKSRATLAADFVVPAVGATATLTVEDLSDVEIGPGAQVFASGDTIRLRYINRATGLTVGDAWGTVTGYVDNGDGTQSYTWTSRKLSSGVQGKTIFKGSVALDYGKSGDKLIVSTVLDAAGSPYTRMLQWTDTNGDFAPDTYTVLASMGNLGGITDADFGTLSGYGFYSDNAYLKGRLKVLQGSDIAGWVTTDTSFQKLNDVSTSDGYAIRMLTEFNGVSRPLIHVGWGGPDSNGTPTGPRQGPNYITIGAQSFLVSSLGQFGSGWDTTGGGIAVNAGGRAIFFAGLRNGIAGGAIAGINFRYDQMWIGTGTWGNANTPFFVNNSGSFSLGDKFKWDAINNTLVIDGSGTFSGALTAATVTGTVSVSGGKIVAGGGNVTLDDAGILLTTGTNTWNRVRWTDGSYIAADQNVVGTGNGYSLNMNSNFANVIGTYGVFIAASNGVVTVDDVLALSARTTHPPLPANTAVPNIFLYNFNGRELWMATWAGRVKLHDI